MITCLFQTDPDNRIDIEGIRNHPWYKSVQPETKGISIKGNLPTINMKIVGYLEKQLGFGPESLIKAVKNYRHNNMTATYYLLLKKEMI